MVVRDGQRVDDAKQQNMVSEWAREAAKGLRKHAVYANHLIL